MKKMSRPIVFFGTEAFSVTSLQALIDAGYEIVAVVTKPDSHKGRSQKLTSSPVKILAEKANLPVWQPQKVADIYEDIEKLNSPIGVLVSYGKLIPQEVLKLFTPGIINLHPSLLPKYRGPSPIESAILNGDKQTGVSIMQLSSEMDAGPVYSQITLPLRGDENAEDLYKTLAKYGAEQLVNSLPFIWDESLQPATQNEGEATYCKLIKKADGVIDWHKPAELIEREIRAFHTWPKSRTQLGKVEVIISKTHIVPSRGVDQKTGDITIISEVGELGIVCGDGATLYIDTIQPLGKKEMPIKAFLAGYKDKLTIQ